MRIIFAGTPEFAATALKALIAAGHEFPLVLTQPDRPAGRGLKSLPGPVKAVALARGLAVRQPATLRDREIQEELRRAAPDVMVVAAYGLILPEVVIAIPRYGSLNIHASLLPRWRGAAPIQRAILAGDAETGITIMQMDAGLDTGDILLQRSTAMAPAETAGSLHERLARMGAQCIVEALERLKEGGLSRRPQEAADATYASKIAKDEAVLDWHQDAGTLARRVRAFNPVPGAVTRISGTPIKVWQASVISGFDGIPGEVKRADADGIVVACGRDSLSLEILQRAGGRRLSAAEFLGGFSVETGTRCQGPHA